MENNNWSREHDRLIAERCEEITEFVDDKYQGLSFYDHESDEGFGPGIVPVPEYNTDIAACIRAAEAWRVQKQGRHYIIYSAAGGQSQYIVLLERGDVVGRAKTMHEALYEAVKDA